MPRSAHRQRPEATPYVDLTRAEWSALRDKTPLPLADEGLEGAHTLKDHVDLKPQDLAAKLDKDGVATQWASKDIAIAAVNQALADWIKLPGHAAKLETWRIEQAQRVGKGKGFDPRKDLLPIRMKVTGHGASLGTKWAKGGTAAGDAVGNTVVIQLKFAKGHASPRPGSSTPPTRSKYDIRDRPHLALRAVR
ncbi:hypothetical protein ADL01_38335 [Streptomyces sp. NRRL WC-3618]|uniref:RNase A-like domain-containing protein n=1 Tax=Streptomyces sp. NRRL WC-3618 TaxID=1519490 RepID=UPI0006AE8C2F|nr:hypothetical protein ADL01_38335 [Streptomyces sp. NRRL WC-3618]